MKNRLLILCFFSLSCFFSCNKNENYEYVASTSWVASIAQLAGIDEIKTIAPPNLRHPPEYEITASDVLQVSKAKLFLHAGYEVMMKTISESSGIDKDKILKVRTDNSIENIEKQIQMISKFSGTEELAQERFLEYKKQIQEAKELLEKNGISKLRFYVQKDQIPLAKNLGLNICGTFSGNSLTSEQILDIAKNEYDIIIENYHNQIVFSLEEISPKTKLIIWKNFPEKILKDSLYQLVKENIQFLLEIE